jgi:hypothetical protein
MRARDLCYTAVPGIAAGFLIGCGGGGGGGYGTPMMPPPPPPPMVSFSAPSGTTSINFGQAVTLTWTSSNASSCTLTSSSDIGGAFNATQPTAGSVSIAPAGTGNVTYTMTCMGMSGSGTATTAAINVNPSILSMLSAAPITTIGSTLDPTEKGGNPYGLAIAPATSGLITKGDLIVCNFNDGATSTEGQGTAIVGLHPAPGAMPYRIAQSPMLLGCNALTLLPDDSISAAAFSANLNPLVSSAGAVNNPFSAYTFGNPWGEAYVAAKGSNPAALYVSNLDGTIDRITLNGDTPTAFTQIASGFCGSGQPGAIYAPSGLTYDSSIDTLYIVDTSSYSVVAFANVSGIGSAGIVVAGQCGSGTSQPTPELAFSGPSASSARVIAHGGGFIAPLSAALLADGNLLVANADVNITSAQTPNQVFEISPWLPGGFVGKPVQLDTSGTPGALFGIAATVDSQGHQIVYFNDDNANAVMMMMTQ